MANLLPLIVREAFEEADAELMTHDATMDLADLSFAEACESTAAGLSAPKAAIAANAASAMVIIVFFIRSNNNRQCLLVGTGICKIVFKSCHIHQYLARLTTLGRPDNAGGFELVDNFTGTRIADIEFALKI